MREHDTSISWGNVVESAFAQLALANGWAPSKKGWPDFVCMSRDGEWIAVECKPRLASGRLQYLRRQQAAVMDWLQAHGIRCFVSDGVTLEPFRRAQHAHPRDRSPVS